MNQEESIDQKLANYLSGTYTEQQKTDVETWARQSKENARQYTELVKFWAERTPDPKLIDHESVKSKVWSSFQQEVGGNYSSKQRSIPLARIWKVAAIILLLIVPAISIGFFINEGTDNQEFTTERVIEKQNPPGQKSQIQLPDGSKVWLNADSKISFKENFSDSVRFIELEGEAYFEVMPDSLRPFRVNTDKLSVSVLGTGFNVSAYQDENDIIVALVHGSVKVQKHDAQSPESIILTPGNGVSYSRTIDDFQRFSMEDNQVLYERLTAWKYGTLVFDGQDFPSFIREISRWYGIRVKIQGDPPKNWRIRATFENEYLTNILDVISFNKDFSYQLDNKELTLMFY